MLANAQHFVKVPVLLTLASLISGPETHEEHCVQESLATKSMGWSWT